MILCTFALLTGLLGCDTQAIDEPDPPVDECEDLRFTAPDEADDPLTGRILFSSRRTGTWQLYDMKPDGSDRRQLTNFRDHSAYGGRWSPDARQIVFTSDSLGSTAGAPLYLMDADGTNIRPMKVRRIVNDRPDLHWGYWPSWSPDGNQIAYSGGLQSINLDILVYDIPTDSVFILAGSPVYDEFPSWSPDGRRIVFVSSRDGFNELYLMSLDSNSERRITFERGSAQTPIWSPNGEWIVFALGGMKLFGGLKLYHVECQAILPLEIDITDDEFGGPEAWSPDGRKLLAVSRSRHLYLIDLETSTANRLLQDEEVRSAHWSSE